MKYRNESLLGRERKYKYLLAALAQKAQSDVRGLAGRCAKKPDLKI